MARKFGCVRMLPSGRYQASYMRHRRRPQHGRTEALKAERFARGRGLRDGQAGAD